MVEYRKYFMEVYGDENGSHIYSLIREQMDYTMKIVYMSVQSTINSEHLPNCFQLLGFDFLITEDFNVILLEVNTSPSLHYNPTDLPFKEKLFPRMIEELFELTIDEYFPPPPTEKVNTKLEKWIFGIFKINI